MRRGLKKGEGKNMPSHYYYYYYYYHFCYSKDRGGRQCKRGIVPFSPQPHSACSAGGVKQRWRQNRSQWRWRWEEEEEEEEEERFQCL